ncbi:kinesin-domain-containing protein [Fistulina hepatica ATCC 64428]|uniref:Kinesin-domain-containing protein n=1 Tax=Fistulina hepatica ATCC 64428 TaxID=1128425 RepID=A0A0D7A348_9AGAR|nr:kinesin-domain-containing protein [Fistulina hepatica ATCC 64428]
MADSGDGNIKVVVRCRPLNAREIARGAKPLIRMEGSQTFLDPPETGSAQDTRRATERKTMAFSFDRSYWSAGPREEPRYCSQQTLYDDLGKELLDHGFSGFNACILAYGQTGTLLFPIIAYDGPDKGIIPLTCSELFVRVERERAADLHKSFNVEVSYIEIYNEKVRDLLNPKNTGNLRVREHPSLGPYVEDLSKLVVTSYDEMMTLMDEGNKARTVAATNMNETSSRSHAVFTLLLTMKRHDADTKMDTEKVSRISLVDLAGSERANSTGATGQRLKEGANINKSLTTLGKVISALAMQGEHSGRKKKKADEFVPYRDSVLTWLLKDSLGGNSKTAMIAAISPADYEETLSTLRYADQAKKIRNKAVVNEDPNAKLVRELKEELEMLRSRVAGASSEATFDPTVPPEKQVVTYRTKSGKLKTVTKAELQEQMETSEKLMQSLNETWEEKLQRTQEVQREREQALEELGITVEKNLVGVHTPKRMPHLVNLNEDPLMSECLVYQLKPGQTMVGRLNSDKPVAIRLSGENILEEHCYFENNDGKVFLHTMSNSVTFLNGKQLMPGVPHKLRSGFRIILGDHHVFRFNNPEEVRKQRDRATMRSNLQHSITAGDLEAAAASQAESRASSDADDDDADADWTFAKREAAFARLGLNPTLDNLPDDDLNKLFDKISKVKSMRDHSYRLPRPESSLSQAMSQPDDVWSDSVRVWSESGRHLSSDATDDTSLQDTAATPEADVTLKDMQHELEDRLQAIVSEPTSEAEDLKVEKDHMEHQLRLVQLQMKRIIDARARGETDLEAMKFEPIIYSARQLRLIRKVLDKWRAHRGFSMAELVLSSAVLVKEANVISRELSKDVVYNFTVSSGGSLGAPASAVDTIAGLDQFGDVVDPILASATQPSLAVKVLDSRHNAMYVWSLDRLQQQLQRMRNLTTYIDRPSYTQHFSSDEPFYGNPPPEYSFIGNALISLSPLTRRLHSTSIAPIFCRYTSEAIGSCRIDVKVVNVVVPHKYSNGSSPACGSPRANGSSRSSTPAPSPIPPGSKLTFIMTVDTVKGLLSHDFSTLHLQIRLSSIVGPSVASEEVFPSTTVNMVAQSLSDLKFRRSFSIVATSKVLMHFRTGYTPIEFFASVRPTYLERLERWDEMREIRHFPSSSGALTPASGSEAPSTDDAPRMRRSENDFVVQQTHDVVSWLQVCELGPDGRYMPVPVVAQNSLDPGSFSLHQGLQRRIKISMSSNSGHQFPWLECTRVRIGNVRLLDSKGRLHEAESADLITLPLLKDQALEFKPDGTGSLAMEAVWDSSVHNSTLLNKVTPPGHRVLLQLQWLVAVDTCSDPVAFSMGIAIAMQTRDARPPSRFMAFLGSNKILSKSSALFNVKLSPPLTRSARDLWRLDTSEKYVRGEETLGSWKPRGISVVEDYYRLVSTERRAADVQATRIFLASIRPAVGQADSLAWRTEGLLRKTLDLWQRRFGHKGQIVLNQEPSDDESSKNSSMDFESREAMKLVSEAKLVVRSDTATKKGHLLILTDAGYGTWERRWFVLRRPYLYIYAHSNELEEMGVVSLTGVNVESDPLKEVLLGKPHSFTLFTSSNSHALAAPNAKELQSWTMKLDPTRLPP